MQNAFKKQRILLQDSDSKGVSIMMKNIGKISAIIAMMAIILLTFSFCGCSKSDGGEGSDDTSGIVKGLITSNITGEQISGVIVKIGTLQAESDLEGQYELSDVPTGSKEITATIMGFQDYTGTVEVNENQVTFNDIKMTPLLTGGYVSGKVLDEDTGDPIEGAVVSINSISTKSDSEGVYLLTGIPAGLQTILAKKDGFEIYSGTIQVDSVRPSFKQIDMKPSANVGNVKGRVTDKDTGASLEGTTVSIGESKSLSDINGQYELTGITAGQQTISALRLGYSGYSAVIEIKSGETIFYDIAMSPISQTGAIAGFVTDKDSGKGLEDTVISLGSHETQTDQDGKYLLRGIPQGTYTLTAQKAGYQGYSVQVSVTAGEIQRQDIEMTALPTTGAVQGIVTDETTGNALESVLVYIESIDTRTDNEGRYRLTGVESGSRTIVAQKTGYEEYTGTVEIKAGEIVSHDIELTPSPTTGGVTGSVTDSLFNMPLENVQVSIGSAETKTDDLGFYHLTGIEAGTQTIHAQLEGFQNYSDSVEVKAGEVTSKNIVMSPLPLTGSVKGIVTDNDTGEAIEKAWVIIGFNFARTDSNGNYRINGIFAGNRKVYAIKHAYFIYYGNVTVKAGEQVFYDIKMSPFTLRGTVKGKVTDSLYGTPLEDVCVSIGLHKTETDEDGNYRLTGVLMGPRIITACKSHYKFYLNTVSVSAGKTVISDIAMEPFSTTGELQGTITDSSDNSPLENVRVEVGSADTRTDENGFYRLNGIRSGSRSLVATLSGYHQYKTDVTIEAGVTNYYNFSMDEIQETGAVFGIVQDQWTRRHLEDVKITVASSSTYCNRTGGYALRGVPVGTQTITAQKSGYENYSDTVEIKPHEATYHKIRMVAKSQYGNVEGYVTDSGTGNPIKDVEVFIGDKDDRTGKDGYYRLSGIMQGDNTIYAVKPGYQDYTGTVTITATQTVSFNISMESVPQEGAVEGIVTDDEFNEPLMGVHVEIKGKGGGEAYTDKDGYYKISGVSPGSQKIQAKLSDYQVYNDFVNIAAGQTTTFNISMAPIPGKSSVMGIITDEDTKLPIEGAVISVGTHSATSDSSGNYKIRHINPGNYNVTVFKTGYEMLTDSMQIPSNAIVNYDIPLTPLSQ